jgi:tetratricopeptide (TPR) repeat protein
MNKQGVMFGVLGLIVGLVVGFMGANSLNRSAAGQVVPQAPTAPGAITSNSSLPPDHPPIGTSSGDAPSTQGSMQPQVAQAIEKAKQQPQDYEAQMTAADLYYQIQRFDDAAKYYEIAAKLKPGEVEAKVKAGNSYFDKAETAAENNDQATANLNFPIAAKWYTEALAIDPKNVSVRTDLGLTFFLQRPRDIEQAIKEYKTSLSIEPNHEITLQNLALAYREAGDNENYNKTADKLRSINPNNALFKKDAGT